MNRVATIIFAGLMTVSGHGPARAGEPSPESGYCLHPGEARSAIAQFRLLDSSEALVKAASRMQADALAGKLCRWSEQFVYEITLLRRDGRVIHISIDAITGKTLGSVNAN